MLMKNKLAYSQSGGSVRILIDEQVGPPRSNTVP
jgi:hypothetical protein